MACRVLVTGGTGFIGSHLVRALVERGDSVYVLVREGSSLIRLELLDVLESVQIVKGDLRKPDSLSRVISAVLPELVFHLAAYGVRAADMDVEAAMMINVAAAAHLVSACAKVRPRRIVWVGTSFEYSSGISVAVPEDAPLLPDTLYGASKLSGWIFARYLALAHGLPMVTARVFTVYGPMEHTSKLVPYLITSGLRGQTVSLTSGEQKRDYLYIDDLVDSLLRLASIPGIEGMVFNLGSGLGVQVVDLARLILDKIGRGNLLQVGSRQIPRRESRCLVADIRNAQQYLGWRPQVGIESGIEQTIRWYQDHCDVWEMLP